MSDKERYSDALYAVPLNIYAFLKEHQPQLPKGYELLPWTRTREISLFKDDEYVDSIPYECIQDGDGKKRLTEIIYEHNKPYGDITIRELSNEAHAWVEEQGWHNKTPLEACALICSEVGEAVNELRGHTPTEQYGEELADIILRTVDEAKERGIDITKELLKKMEKNKKTGTKGRVK